MSTVRHLLQSQTLDAKGTLAEEKLFKYILGSL